MHRTFPSGMDVSKPLESVRITLTPNEESRSAAAEAASARRTGASARVDLPGDLKTALERLDANVLQQIATDRPADLQIADAITGNTALHTLIKEGKGVLTARRLRCIEIVANATSGGNGQFDRLNASPIQYAIIKGSVPLADILITAGAHVPRFVWLTAIGQDQMGIALSRGVDAFSQASRSPDYKPWPNPSPAARLRNELEATVQREGVANVAYQVNGATKTN